MEGCGRHTAASGKDASGGLEARELGNADTVLGREPGVRLQLAGAHLHAVVVSGLPRVGEVAQCVVDTLPDLVDELGHGATSGPGVVDRSGPQTLSRLRTTNVHARWSRECI